MRQIFIAVALIVALLAFPAFAAQNGNFGTAHVKRFFSLNSATFFGEIIGDTSNTNSLTVDASLAFKPGEVQTIAGGGTILPNRTFLTLVAAGSVTTSTSSAVADGFADGQLLILMNDDSNAITVKDNANTVLSGDIALGQGDTLTLIWFTDTWYQLATSNN
jgi:hypothetical protein